MNNKNESYEIKTTIKPKSSCIELDFDRSCSWINSLYIGVKCEKEFEIYNEKNEKIYSPLRKNDSFFNYQKASYTDGSIPQDYPSTWERKIVNKENPDEVYYIKWKNYSKYYELDNWVKIKKDLLNIILLVIIISVISWILIGRFYKKRIIKK